MKSPIKIPGGLAKLKADFDAIVIEAKALDARKKAINAQLVEYFATEKKKSLEGKGKESGSISFKCEEIALKFEITRKVIWDTSKLFALGNALVAQDMAAVAADLLVTEISVPEVKYSSVLDEYLKQALDDARTVEYGKPSVVFATD